MIVSYAGKESVHKRGIRKGTYRSRHIHKSGEQNTEAHCNGTDGIGTSELTEHNKHDTDNKGKGCQSGRLKELKHGARTSVNIKKSYYLTGYGGTYIGTDNNTEGLF